jgi:hypothetical protein
VAILISDERLVPIPGTKLAKADGILTNEYVGANDYEFTDDPNDAHVVTSLVTGADPVEVPDMHKLVLDIDLPAKLLPSSTEGHFHLFIDKEIPKGPYFDLLRALHAAGIIEDGYLGASEQRGFTSVRLPWIKKPKNSSACGADRSGHQ